MEQDGVVRGTVCRTVNGVVKSWGLSKDNAQSRNKWRRKSEEGTGQPGSPGKNNDDENITLLPPTRKL